MRIAYFCYRAWAFAILDYLLQNLDPQKSQVVFIGTVKDYQEEQIDYSRYQNLHFIDPKNKEELLGIMKDNQIEVALFYGWSWLVPAEILSAVDCLCLHPSLLPKYRGGAPIQHQLINGETNGGLTIFKMDEGIDSGPIGKQREFSLAGSLTEFFQRLISQGSGATSELIHDYETGQMVFLPQQNLAAYPPNKRRRPEESEVRFTDLLNMETKYFYNLVRALDDPYPDCFIKLADDQKFFIKEVNQIIELPAGAIVFDGTKESLNNQENIYLKLKDGWVKVIHYSLLKY